MNVVQQCYDLTKELHDIVLATYTEEQRDKVISEIESLLTERETLLKHIKPPFTSEEEETGRQIVHLNLKEK